MTNIYAPLGFLDRDKRYANEKPYALRYNPADNIPTENIMKEIVNDVELQDIRGSTVAPSFDENGLTVRFIQSQMAYEDWFRDDKIKDVFFPELRKNLEGLLGTSGIQIFEYKIRRRSKTFPVADGNSLEWAQPVSVAHIDFNLGEVAKMVYYHNGPDAEELLAQRYQCINVWKPLKGPVRDWPLALCDAKSIDSANDLVVSDVVYQDHSEENYQVHYNPKQRWLYLSDQQPSEMLVFRCADSWEEHVGPGVPHCSFPYPTHVLDEVPRESIEVRALVLYADRPIKIM